MASTVFRRSNLLLSGFDTTGINSANLHLFYRGEEQFIHVEPATNGGWEYLEFFGRRNDAGLDTLMYVQPYSRLSDGSLHPNPLISTFSDTSVYYFHADNQPGLRLQTPFLGSVPPPLLIEEITKTSVVEYLPGNGATFRSDGGGTYDIFQALNPEWTTGEGYVGQSFSSTNDLLLQIPTPHALNNAPARIFLRIESLQPFDQAYEISLNGNLLQVDTIQGVFIRSYELAYPFPFVGDTQLLRIHIDPQTGQLSDKNFLNFVALTYNAQTDLDGASTVAFPVNNPAMVYYQFHDIAPGNIAVAYDLVNQVRYTDTIHSDSLGIWIAGQANPGLIHLSTDAGILTPSISSGIGSDLSNTGNSANMVLITSHELDASAQGYRNYRQGSTVNPLNVKIVYTDEIYEEFGNGSPHPLAIKRFCKYAIDQWAVKPDYFLLWGKGKADIRSGGINHVPAYGEPVSDIMYVSSFTTLDPTTQAVIGRVPIQSDQQGFDYLDKLATYEGIADAPWMRNGVFVSGALDTTALVPINHYIDSVASDFRMGPMNGRAMSYSWLNAVLEDSSGIDQDSVINGGASVVYLFGIHHTYMGIDHPATYTNVERLPILFALTPLFCDFGHDTLSMGESWVLEPSKGAIAAVGYGSFAYLTPLGNWGEFFSEAAFRNQDSASLGYFVQAASDTFIQIWTDQVYLNHQRCMNILGDPSIHFRSSNFEVWPGDANDDLIANNQDLLAIGLAYGDTGAVRPNATLQWISQDATLWDSSFVGGTNHAHADCNGDGAVNDSDTLAILQNYGLVHNKTHGLLTGTTNDPELAIESLYDTVLDSSHVQLLVRLGTPQHPADSVYGIAWSVFYDPQIVDSATVEVDFDSCWVGQQGVNLLTLVQRMHALGRIDLALTRTDHQPISGEGIISRIGIVVIDNISGKMPGDTTYSPLAITVADAGMINPLGRDLPLQGIDKVLTVQGTLSAPHLSPGKQAAVFPNPTRDEIYVQTASDSPAALRLFDLAGKLVLEQEFGASAHKRLHLGALRAGVYILKVTNAAGEFQVKVTKVD